MSLSFGGERAPHLVDRTLVNDAFYPDVELQQFQVLYRVPAEYTEELIEHQLSLAISRVNDSLAFWRSDQQAAGHNTLAEVPSQQINGSSALVQLYLRAVYCECKSEILQEFSTVERKPVAENLAKTGEETSDRYRAIANHAIRQICGLHRIGVRIV